MIWDASIKTVVSQNFAAVSCNGVVNKCTRSFSSPSKSSKIVLVRLKLLKVLFREMVIGIFSFARSMFKSPIIRVFFRRWMVLKMEVMFLINCLSPGDLYVARNKWVNDEFKHIDSIAVEKSSSVTFSDCISCLSYFPGEEFNPF